METISSSSALIKTLLDYSQIWHNTWVGFGVLIAMIAAVPVIKNLLKEFNDKKRLDYYRELYPISQHKKTFKIIESTKHPGKVYLFDLKVNKKRHIASIGTLYDLHFDTLEREYMNDDVFNSIGTGEYILTRGEIGD